VEKIEFTSFGKIPRLFRDMVITEKLDGTNACVAIIEGPYGFGAGEIVGPGIVVNLAEATDGWEPLLVYAQSRKRVISPEEDNAGFAAWVRKHATELATGLGEGLHFGEWWGLDINRGYELNEKRFSLFNVGRWGEERPACCHVVPTLAICTMDTDFVKATLEHLLNTGSVAAPGFKRPEGVVVYHKTANLMFKATIGNDERGKEYGA
jgi:hypothetical protein